jgi:hypothetical protein
MEGNCTIICNFQPLGNIFHYRAMAYRNILRLQPLFYYLTNLVNLEQYDSFIIGKDKFP